MSPLRLTSRTQRTDFAGFVAALHEARDVVTQASEELLLASADLVETNITVGGAYSPGTPVDEGHALAGWERVRRGAIVAFLNDVPYIRRLEYDGWSRQAPNGFVRLTIRHWRDIVRDAQVAVTSGNRRGGMFAGPAMAGA